MKSGRESVYQFSLDKSVHDITCSKNIGIPLKLTMENNEKRFSAICYLLFDWPGLTRRVPGACVEFLHYK